MHWTYTCTHTHTHTHTHICTTNPPQSLTHLPPPPGPILNTLTDGQPYDGVPGEDIQTAFIPLVVVIYLLAAAGIFFAIACLAFNYIFRNRKYMHSYIACVP